MTIVSNIISVFRVHQLNRFTSTYILPCRRRTDDTRRILIIITVECLFAIVNSWFSDIVLSLIYCKRKLSASDDCPDYLKQNYDLLVSFDLFNSISNVILHCLCSRCFRHELQRIFRSLLSKFQEVFDRIWCCYCHIQYQTSAEQEAYVSYKATLAKRNSSDSSIQSCINLQIKPAPIVKRRRWFNFRWYFTPRPLITFQRCLSTSSKGCFRKQHQQNNVEYHSLTHPNCTNRPSHNQSIKLYYPNQTGPVLVERNSSHCARC